MLELSYEAINPRDQRLEPALVDLLLEPSELSPQVVKIPGNVLRVRPTLSHGLRTEFHRLMRAVGQLTNLSAELSGVRPGAV
jgi:hypothetical protein